MITPAGSVNQLHLDRCGIDDFAQKYGHPLRCPSDRCRQRYTNAMPPIIHMLARHPTNTPIYQKQKA